MIFLKLLCSCKTYSKLEKYNIRTHTHIHIHPWEQFIMFLFSKIYLLYNVVTFGTRGSNQLRFFRSSSALVIHIKHQRHQIKNNSKETCWMIMPLENDNRIDKIKSFKHVFIISKSIDFYFFFFGSSTFLHVLIVLFLQEFPFLQLRWKKELKENNIK